PGTPAEHEGRRAFILVEEFVIGRDPKKVDLCLPDPSIGRMHARIVRRAGSFFICDLGSGNGTHLDGRRLPKHEEYLLPDQCLLQFADQLFYFQAE
ncbi:MAG: FHA domain-containing protein, partial [Clostridia bacterium]|nr:FHA domain-containing protein [Clostridia bacterium]